jgi:SAM-dependent methyltransferase
MQLLLDHATRRVRTQLFHRRARQKVRFILPFIPRLKKPLNVLDLGAGEGYVGEVIQALWGARVALVDIVPMNQTELPHHVYDGRQLPFADGVFDLTLLYFVLHHADDPETVLREALRVSGDRVLVVESVYEAAWDLRLLSFLDRWANRWRSGGMLKAQEEHIHFRTAAAWRALFEALGVTVIAEQRRGRWIHKQVLFVIAEDVHNIKPLLQ